MNLKKSELNTQSNTNILNVVMRKFVNQEESLHSKSFIRIKIVQTFEKYVYGLPEQLTSAMTIYLFHDFRF